MVHRAPPGKRELPGLWGWGGAARILTRADSQEKISTVDGHMRAQGDAQFLRALPLPESYSFFTSVFFLIMMKVALCPRLLGILELEVELSRRKNICSALLTGTNHCSELC